jgi:methoxymalonate biosynthesis protein
MTPKGTDTGTETDTVAVVGVGVVGSGVASRALQAGLRVVAVDVSGPALTRAERRMRSDRRLLRLQGRDHLDGPLGEALPNLELTTDVTRVATVPLVIENTPEVAAQKQRVLEAITAVVGPSCIVASNTSGIPIAELARGARQPDRVVGAHFMNPAAFVDTVEVIASPHTSAATVEALLGWLARMGARGIVVGDGPGFVCNRVLMLAVNEAAQLLDEGMADPASLDDVFTACLGHRMGPLRTADLIGLDTVVASLHELARRLGPRYAPSPALVGLVAAGRLGCKSGSGFFDYPHAR